MDRRKKLPLRLGLSSAAVPSVKVTLPPKRDRSRSLCVDRLPPLIARSPPAVARAVTLGRRCSASGTADRLTVNSCYGHGSSSTDLAARRGVFSRRHYGSVEMLASCDGDSENIVRRFRVETGERSDKEEAFWTQGKDEVCLFGSPSTPVLENPEYQTRWYFKYFLGKLHQNYVGCDSEKTGAQRICLSHTPNKPLTVKSILSNFETLDRIEKGPKEIFTPDIQKDLLLLEEQEGSVNFKFGVLYAEAGQSTDDEMFSNEVGSREFDRFVNLLGEKVRLKGWDKYRGGLDVKGDMTGKYSVYTIYEGHEIIFHVSTLLPYSKDNKQQVERKRHIGNDIVNIIFLNGSYEDHCNFKPSMIKSQFTHIFAVVSYIREEDAYRLSLFSEESVPLFGPSLPCPPVFHNHQEFREFVLVKLINGEKAAFNTPIFAQKRERTLDMLIKDLYNEHMSESRTNMLNRRAFSDVLPETPKGSRRKEEARQVEFVRIGQALKLDTIVKGDAPTSLATTSLFKREPWEPQCFYPDFPHDITCGDSWGNNKLVLGSESGIFLIEEGLTHRMIFDKTVVVKQISVVEAHGILLFRTDRGRDSRVHVFRLTDFEGDSAANSLVRTRTDLRDHKLERTKGCHLYALSRPGGSHLRMAAAVGRRLLVLQWRHSAAWTTWCSASDTDTVDGFQLVRELLVPEAPALLTLIDSPDNHICVGYRHQFDLVSEKTGDATRLHTVDAAKAHLVAALDIYEDDEAELLLCYNHTTHFQKLNDENTTEFDFQWNAVPDNIVCVFPYIMAFTYESIEIRLIINGNLVHNMIMPKLKLITSKSDIFFVSTAPEFFQVRKERIKEDRMERDSSVSPPSSPHSTGSTGSNDGAKPLRVYRISFSCLTGNSPCERREGSRLRPDVRPSRSATASPVPQMPLLLPGCRSVSPRRPGLHKDHTHSASSDSGLGKSVSSSPPPQSAQPRLAPRLLGLRHTSLRSRLLAGRGPGNRHVGVCSSFIPLFIETLEVFPYAINNTRVYLY
ncbi:hypothetical protein MRX96_021462 [Rhipicephalus microplus]